MDIEVSEQWYHRNAWNRMRGTMNRNAQALYLSAGYSDFGIYHDAIT